jgi:sugar lactone lactonase YvrE
VLPESARAGVEVCAPFDHRDELGEAPHWDPVDRVLLRVDYLGGAIHRLDVEAGDQRTITLPEPVSFAIPDGSGHLVVGLRDSVEVVDQSGASLRVLARVDSPRGATRLNDGKIDPEGRLVFGTLSDAREPHGGCYRLGETLEPVFDGVVVSNGLGWDPDRHRFYYVDSWTWRIDVCDLDPAGGQPVNRRPFAVIDPADGMPDGLCVDAEGGVWVALFGGGKLRRFRPDGARDRDVPLPVSHPTSLAFGGDDLRTAFVTTSRHRLTASQQQEQVLAGAVLTFEPGVAGRPPFPPNIEGMR